MKKLKKKNLEKKSRKGTDGLMAAGPFRFECVLRLISTHPDCGTDFKVIRPRCEPGRGWPRPGLASELQNTEREWTQPGTECFLDAPTRALGQPREYLSTAGTPEQSCVLQS